MISMYYKYKPRALTYSKVNSAKGLFTHAKWPQGQSQCMYPQVKVQNQEIHTLWEIASDGWMNWWTHMGQCKAPTVLDSNTNACNNYSLSYVLHYETKILSS